MARMRATPEERAEWWPRAVAAWPPYEDYQKNSDRRIPVVILTTSKAEEDILKTYDLHANCYITKPVDLEQFMKVVKCIEEFWLTMVKLPSHR